MLTINHPDYYKHGDIEAIDVIDAWQLNFNLGNVIKYVARADYKTNTPLSDLMKAQFYLNREVERRKKALDEKLGNEQPESIQIGNHRR